MSVLRCDAAVIGSGAGGACVAARLADAGAEVLLIEQGRRAFPRTDAMEVVSDCYADAGFTTAAGNSLMPIPTGRTLGGTTTINSGTCLSTPPGILKQWERASRGGFSAAGFSIYLDEVRRLLRVKPAPERTRSESSRLILKGAARLGLDSAGALDRCEDGCRGEGRCCFVCPSGGKMTSEKAFLETRADNPRLRILTGAALLSVSERRRAGVPVRAVLRSQGKTFALECGIMVLSAGTLASPYFVRRWSAEAGRGLSVHPAAKLFAEFEASVRGWEGVPQGVGFEDSADPDIRFEGVYTPPELAALTMPLEGLRLREWMERYDRVATFGFMIRDEARGRVRYPMGPSRPWIRYDMTPRDLRLMGSGMRRVAEVFFAAGAKRVVLPLNRAGNVLESEAALKAFDPDSVHPRDLQTMAFHPLGTCAIGRVVDYELRAAPGVFVCDGSVVPESLGVNPQMTIYAFALRLADYLIKGGVRDS